MNVLLDAWRLTEKILFKIKIGTYHWGYLRYTVYRRLNQKYVNARLPEKTLALLRQHISYGPIAKISIIIPTRNRLESLKKYLLPSLLRQEFGLERFEVIIVDNSPGRKIFQRLTATQLPANYHIAFEKTVGISRACNAGLKVASGDVIIFLQDDAEVDPQWLSRIERFYSHGRYLLGEGLMFDMAQNKMMNLRDQPYPEQNFLDATLSYRRGVFDYVSFNENMIYGCEGWDLLSQVLVFWPDFLSFFDAVPLKHYRQPSEFRNAGAVEINWKGRAMLAKMTGLWQTDRHCLRRNLDINAPFFTFRFWFKELTFFMIELALVRGDVAKLLRSKLKIYQQLVRIKAMSGV